jgi:hypothetical protein
VEVKIRGEIDMGWVRLHKLPKACRKDKDLWGAKEKYLFDNSFKRYSLTEDGRKTAEMEIARLANPVIGRYEEFIFFHSGSDPGRYGLIWGDMG